MAYNISSGESSNDIILENDSMTVLDGGVAENTTVNTHGSMWVSSGGTANNTTVSGYAAFVFLSNGGIANNNTVNNAGSLDISSGAVANSTTVISGGQLNVYSGGTANNTTVNSNGHLCVYSGGTANNTTVNSGYYGASIYYGGIANSITVFSGGSLYVSSGGTANSAIVNSGGSLYVFSGGTANSITVNSGGQLNVYSGGTATDIVWTPCAGHVYVSYGAITTYAGDHSGVYYGSDNQLLSHETQMDAIDIARNGEMHVMSGGTVNSASVHSSGFLCVASGGTASDIAADSGARMDLTIAPDTEIAGTSGDISFEIKNGSAVNYSVASGNVLHVASGGLTSRAYVSGGTLDVLADGIATSTIVNAGDMVISSGGTADTVAVNSNARQIVLSGGTATNITASSTRLVLTVSPDTLIAGTSGGSDFAIRDGIASGYSINSGGELHVCSGGMANSTGINYGGNLYISSGGTANNTTVNSFGRLTVSSGGTADQTTVDSGGYLYISSGGTLTGRTIYFGGTISAFEGAVVDFDLTERAPGTGARISNLAGLKGTPNWTITVNADQAEGIYTLARGAAGFNQTITVVNKVGDELGTLTVGGTTVISDVNYVLSLSDDGQLSLKIGEEIPPSPYTSDGLILINDAAKVNSGEVFHDTLIGQGGWLQVYSGGTALETLVISGGTFFISSDGTADSTTILSSGAMIISPNGTANATTVNQYGSMIVSSGGLANSTTVNTAGTLIVSKGGTACDTIVSGICDDNMNYTWGNVYVSGGTVIRTELDYCGHLEIIAGSADSVTLGSRSWLAVSAGGTATDVIEDGGFVSYETGAQVTFASHTFSGKELTSGVTATVHSGTTANSITVCSGGELQVFSGGTAVSTEINSRGSLHLSSGGIADSTTVNSGGSLNVYSSGTANNTNVYSGGNMSISRGGTANGTTVNYGGSLNVSTGGTANSTTVNSRGSLNVNGGGTANSTTVNEHGYLYIHTGGTATEIIENGGYVSVDDKADVTFRPNSFSNLTLSWNATVHSGTTANSTTVNSNGVLFVSSGGTVNNTTVNYGGKIYINGGGKLTGRMSFESGADVSASVWAILNFDLTQTSAEAEALVNDLSILQGTPIYTITVSGTESSGIYRLANGITFFNSVISVMNTEGEQLGSLLAGQKLETKYADYTLKVSNGCLTVTVDRETQPAADTEAPTAPAGLMPVVDGRNVALLWNESTDDTGVKEYVVTYSHDGETSTVRTTIPHYVLNDADYGAYSWSVQAVDAAGNESEITVGGAFTVSNFKPHIVEYSTDNFEHVLRVTVGSDALDSFRLPAGTYQSRSRAMNSADWTTSEQPIVSYVDKSPALVQSDADGNADLFFANASGTWESGYAAKHMGSLGGWSGTGETILLSGKNKLADIFEGSTDANILLMTDDSNGDALFVDDIYTALPGTVEDQQARIARIDEIRAGTGNDIVDMTSQRFEYIGDGLTIRGGDGDDVIWANKGDNWLFGDDGNDRIIGASGNDVIVGGIGNDSLHGGSGNDVFAFCDNWGVDTVEQLETGTVTLWFASGDESNWDAETLTYSDGDNSVTVSGVDAEKITLKFGDDSSEQFAALSNAGAFDAFTSRRIFEESDSGILVSL